MDASQGPRLRMRGRGAGTGGGGGGGGSTLAASDFTYLGAYKIPSTSNGDIGYGMGLAVRYESSDATNQVHLLTAAYHGRAPWSGTQHLKLEMRGTALKVYVDSTLVISTTDSSITAAGKAGVSVLGNLTYTQAGYDVDTFTATNAGGSAFVSDTFTDSNGTALSSHTGGTGATWTQHGSYTGAVAEIQTNKLRYRYPAMTDATALYYASGTPSSADYDVEADLTLVAGAYSEAGVVGRVNTAANTFYRAFYSNSSSSWFLEKYVAGVQSTIAYAPTPSGAEGQMAHAYEWRDATPTIPGSPYLTSSYGTATMMCEWGDIYTTDSSHVHPSKRITKFNGQTNYDMSDGAAGLIRGGSLYWDTTDSRLYWTFVETYENSPSTAEYVGYSDLNYANCGGAGAITPHGAWSISARERKGGMAGVTAVPSSFISAASLGSQRLAVIGSRPASNAASGDTSFGPALTTFAPPAGGATEQTALSGTRLVGYPYSLAPGPGYGRPTRPAGLDYYPAGNPNMVLDDWGATKWTLNDFSVGGAWIHGASKSGYVTVNALFKGQANYLSASVSSESIRLSLSIISEADLLAVKQGSMNEYDVQPTITELLWDQLNPTDYTSVARATISTVTSDSAKALNSLDGALVTTTTPHGITTDNSISVRGTSRYSEYDALWNPTVVDATHFYIHNANLNLFNWSGVTATGGTVYSTGHSGYFAILGVAYDPTASKFYIGYVAKDLTPMVAVWSVNN